MFFKWVIFNVLKLEYDSFFCEKYIIVNIR